MFQVAAYSKELMQIAVKKSGNVLTAKFTKNHRVLPVLRELVSGKLNINYGCTNKTYICNSKSPSIFTPREIWTIFLDGFATILFFKIYQRKSPILFLKFHNLVCVCTFCVCMHIFFVCIVLRLYAYYLCVCIFCVCVCVCVCVCSYIAHVDKWLLKQPHAFQPGSIKD